MSRWGLLGAYLFIYIFELFLRFFGKNSWKSYFSNYWNYFDIFIVLIALIPSSSMFSALRALRILRVFKTLKGFKELRIIISVIFKSLKSLYYTTILFFIFMYVYAVIGVTLFRYPKYSGSLYEEANNGYLDPYGTLGEGLFTLFKMTTGEGWDVIRNNLIQYTDIHSAIITFYHVSWMIIAAFMLINLVIGIVLNNFDQVLNEMKESRS